MDWRDEGVLLSVRRHGESAAIIECFTREHGRHAGVVRGGASRKMAPLLQPGAQLSLEWRARLAEHLGAYRVELERSRTGAVLNDGDALAALGSAAALLLAYLPEREPYGGLYHATVSLMDALGANPGWPAAYVGWELALLSELGFPLDLGRCAATGGEVELTWVSPKTGRAVSAAAGAPYADRLLPLPAFLTGGEETPEGVCQGLRLTGYFMKNWVAPSVGSHEPPPARERFEARMKRIAVKPNVGNPYTENPKQEEAS